MYTTPPSVETSSSRPIPPVPPKPKERTKDEKRSREDDAGAGAGVREGEGRVSEIVRIRPRASECRPKNKNKADEKKNSLSETGNGRDEEIMGQSRTHIALLYKKRKEKVSRRNEVKRSHVGAKQQGEWMNEAQSTKTKARARLSRTEHPPQATPPARGHASSASANDAPRLAKSIHARCVLHPRRYAAVAKLHPTRPARLDTGCLIQGTPAANSKHGKSGIDIDEATPRRIVHAGLVSTIQNAPRHTRQDNPANEDPANEYTLVDVPPRLAEHRRPRLASSKTG
ncbi:hypothetical protein B0H13DRAFT_2473999 [Mycena leptocephala]|nr:hypothetical protein B0H13DRAFT_2473999 [Mycena leptocephala]